MGDKGRSPEGLAVCDVSSGTARKRAYREEVMPESLGGKEDLAVSPDGNEIATADGVDGFVTAFRPDPSGGTSVRALGIQGEPEGVVCAAVRRGCGHLCVPAGGHPGDAVREHRRLQHRAATRRSVSAPVKAPPDGRLTLTGTFGLVLPDLPGSLPAEVTWTDLASPEGKPLGARTVWLSRDRRFAIEDSPAAGGKVTYALRYPGDAPAPRSPSRATGRRRPWPAAAGP
ncbi:hypothetical protein PV682_41675 [Streptomyces niveiscabiei]|uniref:hypothetical protein n=1 Tax=Streptomyces niveiscabiei TaxID=164115 RepID=UPI0029B371DD|nr:hypothetical protein [Streptomyces niveiscabiei]MDX3387908.1 hypothetical protein [Streptomyces niveiscabiei]